MLGRDAHIINNLSNPVLPSYMLILVFHCLPRYQERVHLWNHEPGPFLIIRNTFPTLLSPLLFAAIIKSENTKTLLHLAFIIKNPKNIIYHYYHHPCIFILPSLHIYYCLHIYFIIILTPCAWQPLGEVEGTKQFILLQVLKRRIRR